MDTNKILPYVTFRREEAIDYIKVDFKGYSCDEFYFTEEYKKNEEFGLWISIRINETLRNIEMFGKNKL